MLCDGHAGRVDARTVTETNGNTSWVDPKRKWHRKDCGKLSMVVLANACQACLGKVFIVALAASVSVPNKCTLCRASLTIVLEPGAGETVLQALSESCGEFFAKFERSGSGEECEEELGGSGNFTEHFE